MEDVKDLFGHARLAVEAALAARAREKREHRVERDETVLAHCHAATLGLALAVALAIGSDLGRGRKRYFCIGARDDRCVQVRFRHGGCNVW